MEFIVKLQWKLFLIGAVFAAFALLTPISASAQNLSIDQVEVTDIKDNAAIIKWSTPDAKTDGIVYLGESETLFDRSFTSAGFAYTHQLSLDNLKKNKTYFYKILARDEDGDWKELFIRTFNTGKMPDTKKPEFLGLEIVTNSCGAILLRWATNEETSAIVDFGTDAVKLSQRNNAAAYATRQETILYNLKSGSLYHIRVSVRDRDGNTASRTISASASGQEKDMQLSISNIAPAFSGSSLISAHSVLVSFKSNLPAKSRIRYGTNPKALTKKIEVSTSRDIKHGAELSGLLPLTTYFYTIEIYDSLYRKSLVSDVMSFETMNVGTRYPNGELVRAAGQNKVYIIYKNTKTWIESPAAFLGLGFKGEWVQDVPASTLDDYAEGKSLSRSTRHPSGCLIKYADKPTVYFIENGTKHPIGSPVAFLKNGFRWERIITVSKWESYLTGGYIS